MLWEESLGLVPAFKFSWVLFFGFVVVIVVLFCLKALSLEDQYGYLLDLG